MLVFDDTKSLQIPLKYIIAHIIDIRGYNILQNTCIDTKEM